jgi:hypothetical protein
MAEQAPSSDSEPFSRTMSQLEPPEEELELEVKNGSS